jgi:hypothetical protein
MTASRDNKEGFDLEAARQKLESLQEDSDEDQRKIRGENCRKIVYESLASISTRLFIANSGSRSSSVDVQRIVAAFQTLENLDIGLFLERGAESASRLTLAEQTNH